MAKLKTTNTKVIENSTLITKTRKISVGDSIHFLSENKWKVGKVLNLLDISELRIQISFTNSMGVTCKEVVGLTEIKI